MKNANQQFADYATSVAFHVSLSRKQIIYMCNLHECGRGVVNTFIMTGEALEKKGLIQEIMYPGKDWRVHVLTEAGLHLIKLFKLAGLYKTDYGWVDGKWNDKNLEAFQREKQQEVAKRLNNRLRNMN